MVGGSRKLWVSSSLLGGGCCVGRGDVGEKHFPTPQHGSFQLIKVMLRKVARWFMSLEVFLGMRNILPSPSEERRCPLSCLLQERVLCSLGDFLTLILMKVSDMPAA